MNDINRSTASTTNPLNRIDLCMTKLFETRQANQAMLYCSATNVMQGIPWNAQMGSLMHNTHYLAIPDLPAVAALASAIETNNAEHNHHHVDELGLLNMLANSFGRTDWHAHLWKNYLQFKKEHDMSCIDPDLLTAFEAILCLCINSRVQGLLLLHLNASVETLKKPLCLKADQ